METKTLASNPWSTIWTQPRRTVRALVETRPTYLVPLLAVLVGIAQALSRAAVISTGDNDSLATILVGAAAGGAVFGVLRVYIGGPLIQWTGTWLGGSARAEPVQTALAWGGVPLVAALVLWVPALLLFGKDLFTSATPRLDGSLIYTVLGVWAFVLTVKGVAEVHGFSAWRAIAAILLAVPMFLVFLLSVASLFILLGRAVGP